jgi:hypothetical protein
MVYHETPHTNDDPSPTIRWDCLSTVSFSSTTLQEMENYYSMEEHWEPKQ